MLYTILAILKIIGIVLLVILGILLFVVLMVLLMPIRYYMKGEYTADIKRGSINAHWLFYIVSFQFLYDNHDISYYLKVFGYSFITNDAKILKKREVKRARKSEKAKNPKKKVKEESKIDVPSAPVQKTEQSLPEKRQAQRIEEKKRKTLIGFLKKIIASIKGMIELIKKAFAKIKNVRDIKDEIIDFIKEEETKLMLNSLTGYLIRFSKYIRPRQIQGYLRFGFEDPSITGQVLGILAMGLPLYKNSIKIFPVFYEAVLEALIEGKGHMSVIHFVHTIISMSRDKILMKQIKKIRNRFGGNSNGK